jgi:ubiquitin
MPFVPGMPPMPRGQGAPPHPPGTLGHSTTAAESGQPLFCFKDNILAIEIKIDHKTPKSKSNTNMIKRYDAGSNNEFHAARPYYLDHAKTLPIIDTTSTETLAIEFLE